MKDKLSIGIIGTRGIPNRYGGFEAFAEHVSLRLAARGHQVTVYCSHNQQYRETVLNGVNLVFRFNPESITGTAGQFAYDLSCNLHAGRQSFDVILHLGYTSDSVWSWLWSKKALHITNMDGIEWKRSKYSHAVQSFLKKAEKWAAARSSLLIADSKEIQAYLESKYHTPVRYISYGAMIPENYGEVPPGDFKAEKYGYDLVIARMEPENNIELAIEAKLCESSTIPLMVFSNDTKYGDLLKKKYLHENLIRFHKANYQVAALNSLRHYARYYIHGHSAGGTNPSLLEAMACGCRILAHDNPFNREVLENNAGYYPDANQLTALLTQPLPDDGFRRQIINNLDTIRKHHDWEYITNEYEKAFYQVLEQ